MKIVIKIKVSYPNSFTSNYLPLLSLPCKCCSGFFFWCCKSDFLCTAEQARVTLSPLRGTKSTDYINASYITVQTH